MNRIKLFEAFTNEAEVKSKLKYSKNYVQQDQNWLKDITQAQTEDRWANSKAYRLGGPGYAPGTKEKAPGEKEIDPIKSQRDLAQRIDPDEDWSTKTNVEIKKYLNDFKKRLKDELEDSKAYFSIREKLEEMVKYNKISIECMGDSVPDNLKVRFVLPCITSSMSPKDAWEFIHDVTSLEVKVTGRNVVDKWEVVYTGTIVAADKKMIEFHDVNNGLAVNLG